MSPIEFDTNASNSDLHIGIEVEYPVAPSFREKYTARGQRSNDLKSAVRGDGWPSSIGGRATHDGTVGLEVVSTTMELVDAENWYRDTIEYLENDYQAPHAPTGIISGSTAGLHIHLSDLSQSQAETLYEISTSPWAKVLFCSSIISSEQENDWRVFRGGGYCRFNGPSNNRRYNCVNRRNGGHYEWRMPEPIDPDHFPIIVKFLRLFEQDTEAAIQYAQEILDSGDDRVTSIRRAEAVGMDIEDMPAFRRSPFEESEEFFEEVRDSWSLPEIWHVSCDDGEFYLFQSRLDTEFSVNGVEFRPDDILYADSLDHVSDEELHSTIRKSFARRNESTNETEATQVVKDIIKKKK